MRSRRRKQISDIAPLNTCVQREVRFEECDPLGIMWHGRYASWLEDGREALGKLHGIHYLDFYTHGVAIPIKVFHLDYSQPLRYGNAYAVHTSLFWSEAALLDMEYRITDSAGRLMTSGWTTQLMVSLDGELLLEQPEFYRLFRESWMRGEVAPAPGRIGPEETPCR